MTKPMKSLSVDKVRTICSIGRYYYGYAKIEDAFYICIQQMGDKGWLVKEEKFFSTEAVIAEVKKIEKEHYDKLKLKNKETHTQTETS